MTIRSKLELFAGAVVACALAILVSSWNQARNDQSQLQSALDSQKVTVTQAQQQIRALQDADKNRDKATQSQIAALRKSAAQMQTPLQIANWLPSQLDLPSPIAVSLPASSTANPASPAVATIPQQDLPSLRDLVESCTECKAQLATVQKDLASRDQQLKLAGEELSASERARDAAIAAAKGGTFWHRVARNTRWFLIGAGAGAATICATRHCH